jgi:hypothetical protein
VSQGRPCSAAGAPVLLAHQTLGASRWSGLWRSAPGRTVGGSRRTGRRVEVPLRHGLSVFISSPPSPPNGVEGRHLSACQGRSSRQPRLLASGSPRDHPGASGPGTPKIRARCRIWVRPSSTALPKQVVIQVAGRRPVIDSVPALVHPLFSSLFSEGKIAPVSFPEVIIGQAAVS